MAGEPLLRLENAYKTWSAGARSIEILRGIDLEVHAEDSLAIMGPSGAGKSTLLHVLGCLTPVDRGTLWVDGKRALVHGTFRDSSLRRRFGFVFQDGKLIPGLNVLENVCVPLAHRGVWPTNQRKLGKKALAEVGLEDHALHRPDQLSSGEIIRVAIARALVFRPSIVLADEPTGNLDSITGRRIANLLFGTVREGRTLILATHHKPLARRADRMLFIKDGLVETRN